MTSQTPASETPAPRPAPRRDPPPAGTPELPPVELHLCPPKAPGIGTVVASEVCTASRKAGGFVRHVSIDISGTEMAGRFRPGQSFGVIPPGEDARGRKHSQRLYSIASPSRGEAVDGAAPGSILATTVKRTIDEHWDDHSLFLGVCSNHLCDLKPGDKVTITGPSGKRFLLPTDPSKHDYIFFATGTGIAPFRGMVYDLLENDPASRIVLVMGTPYATDLLYHKELTELAERYEGFTYITAISRERQADTEKHLYVQDRLETHAELFKPMLASERTLLYVCGIAGMELGIFRWLATELDREVRDQYLRVDPEAEAHVDAWDRKTLGRQVRPTKRSMIEVY